MVFFKTVNVQIRIKGTERGAPVFLVVPGLTDNAAVTVTVGQEDLTYTFRLTFVLRLIKRRTKERVRPSNLSRSPQTLCLDPL